METPPNPPDGPQTTPQPVADQQMLRAGWQAGLRAHWLALGTYAIYAGRWVQYIVEARAYHAQPEPGGAGDSLNWLLGQLGFALLFALVLLTRAIWWQQGRLFYAVLGGLVLLPFLLQYLIEG